MNCSRLLFFINWLLKTKRLINPILSEIEKGKMLSKFKENKFFQSIHSIVSNKFLRQGLPLIILVVGGSFALTISQKIKVDYKRSKQEIQHLRLSGLEEKMKPVNLEDEYQKMQQVDMTYENIRGPRPYEDDPEWEINKKIQEKRFQEKLQQMQKT